MSESREEKKESFKQESMAWKIIKALLIINVVSTVCFVLTVITLSGINSYERLQYDYVGETNVEQKTDQGGDVSSIISKEGVSVGVPVDKNEENKN